MSDFLPFRWNFIWTSISFLLLPFAIQSEKSVRGIFLSVTPIAASFGQFIIYLLGSFTSWRHLALGVSILPIIIIVAVYLVIKFQLSTPTRNNMCLCWFHFNWFMYFRYRKRRIGCCRKIDQTTHSNPFSGCADGFRPKQFMTNSRGWTITTPDRMYAFRVRNILNHANIRNRSLFTIKSKSWGAHEF